MSTKVKHRLDVLDGLRGFASLSVMLSHSNFNPVLFGSIPFLLPIYKTLSVGPNSVQIFFVLCGFLMAFLYPVVPNYIEFIRKRYARIFPMYSVIVFYLWLTTVHNRYTWNLEIVILLGTSIVMFCLWKLTVPIHKYIFYLFIILQVTTILFNSVFVSKILGLTTYPMVRQLISLFTNLTMTTELTKDIGGLSFVFWSLSPEVIFYLYYPLIAITLMQLGKKFGWIISLLIIIGTTKIVFGLDGESLTYLQLFSMSLARSSGFIAGIVAGNIYRNQGVIWLWLKKISQHHIVNIIFLLSFVFIQAGDWIIRDGHSRGWMNYYYLASSWIFALVVLSALIEGTILNKLFTFKPFRFIGMISYSLYLSHPISVGWARQITYNFPIIKDNSPIYLLLAVLISIFVAWLLYMIVDRLYFSIKFSEVVQQKSSESKLSSEYIFSKKSFIGIGIAMILIVLVYVGTYSPTILVERHSIVNTKGFSLEQSLLDNPLRFCFISGYSNLSIVATMMHYQGSAEMTRNIEKHPAQLVFKLYDESNKKLLYETKRSAFDVESFSVFPFGFPSLVDSKGKKYYVEYSQEGGGEKDSVVIHTISTPVITQYTISRSELLRNPFILIFNRIGYILKNNEVIFALGFFMIVGIFILRQKKLS
ncbi:MAG: acyltransferase [Candidatus Roizmanbacteria bacterium]